MTADNRGIQVSYEAIRLWCRKFGPLLATELRRRHPRRGDKWYLDEVALTINKHRYWLQLFGVALQMGSRTELIHLRSQPRGCTRGSSRQPDGGPHNRRWRRRVPPMASTQGRSTAVLRHHLRAEVVFRIACVARGRPDPRCAYHRPAEARNSARASHASACTCLVWRFGAVQSTTPLVGDRNGYSADGPRRALRRRELSWLAILADCR